MDVNNFLKKIAENKDAHILMAYIHGRGQSYIPIGNPPDKIAYPTALMSSSDRPFPIADNKASTYEQWISPTGIFVISAYLKRDYILLYDNTPVDCGIIHYGPLVNIKEQSEPITKKIRTGFLWLKEKNIEVGRKELPPLITEEKDNNNESLIAIQMVANSNQKEVGRSGGWIAYAVILPKTDAETFLKLLKGNPNLFITMLKSVAPNIRGIDKLDKAFFVKNPEEFKSVIAEFYKNNDAIKKWLTSYRELALYNENFKKDKDFDLLKKMDIERDIFDSWMGWVRKMYTDREKRKKIPEITKILDNWI